VRVWNLETGACERVLAGHNDTVDAVAVSRDGARAVSASADRTVRVWSLNDGRPLQVLQGHSGGVRAVAITASGDRAISGAGDRSVRHWRLDVESAPVPAASLPGGPLHFVAISSDGRRAVSCSRVGQLNVWDAALTSTISVPGTDAGHG